jgi:putative addiction module killer protein
MSIKRSLSDGRHLSSLAWIKVLRTCSLRATIVLMEVKPRQVAEYVTSDDLIPFKIWIDSLKNLKGRVVIHKRITRLRSGLLGDVESVGDGVHELRIDFGPGYRIYFGNDGEALVLLLCGGIKRSQTKDISQAKEYWKDYKNRKEKGLS